MKKKSAPKAAPGIQAVATPPWVTAGNVFVAFMNEATSLAHEVEARRKFQTEVGEFLAERGLIDAFTVWQKTRTTA